MDKKTEIDYTQIGAYALAQRYYAYESRRVKTPRAIIRAALEFRRNYRVEVEHKPTPKRCGDCLGWEESQVIATPRPGCPGAQKTLYTITYRWESRALRFNDQEREYRRTLNDAKFRKSLLCQLQRELQALNKAPAMTLDAITAWSNDDAKREQTYKAIAERIRRISARSKIPNRLVILPNVGYLTTSQKAVRKCGGRLDMRGADAQIILTCKTSRLDYREGWTEWSGGRPISYTRATRDNYVRSFGVIKADGLLLQAVCAERTFEQIAPEGYKWILEGGRIALQRTADAQIRKIYAAQLLDPKTLTNDFPALPEAVQQAS